MANIIKNFPFTSLLALFGFFVGLFFLSTLDFSMNYNFSEIVRDPVNLFVNYFKESFAILIKGVMLGITIGVVLGFAGFIIDFLRKKPDLKVSEPLSVQEWLLVQTQPDQNIFKQKSTIFYYWEVIKVTRNYATSPLKMHILQPKHIKLKEKEAQELLEKFNISKAQLPKILSNDPALSEGCVVGDVIKIERKEEGKINLYYRVVV